MIDIKETIAKNIIALRKVNSMTQLELATQINYSDKAVSKWERAESVPDILVLKNLARIFAVNVDYIISEHDDTQVPRKPSNRLYITLLSSGLVWLAAIVIFVVWYLADNASMRFIWVIFVYAVPCSMIVALVFACKWGTNTQRFWIVSVLEWSVALSIIVSFNKVQALVIMLMMVPMQALTVFWFLMKKKK